MILLDTDIFTLYFIGNAKVRSKFAERLAVEKIALPVVVTIEALQGRFDGILKAANAGDLLRAMARLEELEQALKDFRIVPLNDSAAREFERLLANKKLKKIGRADLLIASIALASKAILVTRNTRHFEQIPSLRLENWAD
jgi:tRNA(fMet)-specific endonuclease VapC